MARTHIVTFQEIIAHCRGEAELCEYVRWKIGGEPTEVITENHNRRFVIISEGPEFIDSTAVVLSVEPGKLPITRRRRHPKESSWPEDVRFKESQS